MLLDKKEPNRRLVGKILDHLVYALLHCTPGTKNSVSSKRNMETLNPNQKKNFGEEEDDEPSMKPSTGERSCIVELERKRSSLIDDPSRNKEEDTINNEKNKRGGWVCRKKQAFTEAYLLVIHG